MSWFPRQLKLDPAAERTLDRLTAALNQFSNIGVSVMTNLAIATADLTAATNANTAAVNAAMTEIQTLVAKNSDLSAWLASAIAANDGTAIEASAQQIASNNASLQALVDATAATFSAQPAGVSAGEPAQAA